MAIRTESASCYVLENQRSPRVKREPTSARDSAALPRSNNSISRLNNGAGTVWYHAKNKAALLEAFMGLNRSFPHAKNRLINRAHS
eukprot:scaffold35324_cov58-Phaeocystis_antarctica.AAC.1